MHDATLNSRIIFREGPDWPDQFSLSDLFGDDRPVELEIGSGKGLFLERQGSSASDRGLIGVEYARKYACLAAERVCKRGLTNVRVFCGDARQIVPRFPENSLAAVHVYFPDPWWKRRHLKRRLIDPPFVNLLARLLRDNAPLHLATDVAEYADVMSQTLQDEAAFSKLPIPAPEEPRHDLDYLTHFERKYRQEGRSIHRLSYLRRPR